MPEGPEAFERRPVARVTARAREAIEDAVVVERALELRVGGRALTVTLRTPGHDAELALGLLAAEDVIRARAEVGAMHATPARCADEADVLDVTLADGVMLDWSRLERTFAASSACGLCGRAHLEALRLGLRPLADEARFAIAGVLGLSAAIRGAQAAFTATGGLHAAAWCNAAFQPVLLREDVGRHNAVDKVCGALLERHRRPVGEGLLWVSGRAGAEIVLKAARAGIPALVAVGAPTTLAIDLAEAAGLTLAGFLRDGRMNVYTRPSRIVG